MDDIQTLPQELHLKTKADVQLHDYSISNSVTKNKIVLSKNVFSFLLEGNKELITQGKSTHIDNQKFLIIKSGNCLMSENISVSNLYRSMLLFFGNDSLVKFINKHAILFSKNKPSTPYLVCEYDDYIRHFVGSLQQLQQASVSLQDQLLATKFEEILLYLIEKKSPQFLHGILGDVAQTDIHFTTTIESNRYNLLSVQELAFLCNMSVSTFKRHFETEYRASPIRWFQEQRLELATHLLQKKANRPSDVFSEVGFESLASFTKAFKEKYQTTPKRFQNSF